VVVADEGALCRRAYRPVVAGGGVEREQALNDADPQPGGDTPAVVLQGKRILEVQMTASTRRRSPSSSFMIEGWRYYQSASKFVTVRAVEPKDGHGRRRNV
jgi:hypothetical protein